LTKRGVISVLRLEEFGGGVFVKTHRNLKEERYSRFRKNKRLAERM
jgi:hypothetical protein